MKVEIEVTDDNEYNAGWLGYLLGLDRPAGQRDEDGRYTAAQNGWDMGKETPDCARVRHVFTRQSDIDHPQYVVRDVTPMPVVSRDEDAALVNASVKAKKIITVGEPSE